MIICAGNNENFSFAKPMGVGLVEMSINLTRLCLFDRPEFLLFVGTAGSYGKHNIFDVIETKTASNIELSFLDNNSYTPLDNVVSTNTTDKKDVVVNSSNYISTNFDLSKKYNSFGVELENMEFFAFLKVAQEFEISAGGVFCVTNYTNQDAHSDFLTNHDRAKDILTKHINNKLER